MIDDFFTAIAHWNAARANGEYLKAYELSAYAMMISDTRSSTGNATMLLIADQKEAGHFIGNAHTLPTITAHLQKKFKSMNINEESTRTFLDEMVGLGLVASMGEKYIALATTEPMPEMMFSYDH